jgi:hypothetical protein
MMRASASLRYFSYDRRCSPPPEGKGISSREEKAKLRSMERKRILILGILLFLLCCIIFMTLWLAGHLG